MLFPEGHRSTDGQLRPFRSAGFEAMLRERSLPVYLVLNDGLWRVRRLVDLLFHVHRIDAVAEVMGPYLPPADPAQLPAFLLDLRETRSRRLAERRARASAP